MLTLLLSLTLLADPGDDNFAVRNTENEMKAAVPDVQAEACSDPSRAEHLCNTAFQLWDLTQRIDREADLCKVQVFTLERKLQTLTATTVVHTKIVEVPVRLTPLEEMFQYVGAGLLFLGGFGLGYLAFH